MSEEDRDPYAPPRSEVEVTPAMRDGVGVDQVLRWVGTACLAFLVVGVFRGTTPDVTTKVIAVAMVVGLVLGFLLGGKKWHLAIAILMLLGVGLQMYFLKLALQILEREVVPVGASYWWGIARAVLMNLVTAGCGIALYVRARRAERAEGRGDDGVSE